MNQSEKIRVAINGFGRIGRAFFKLASANSQIEVVAINDLATAENLIYLLKYDTIYPSFSGARYEGGKFHCDQKEISFFNEPDPRQLPWQDLRVDVVIEATGVFETYQKANAHIEAGAKRVILTAPVKEEGGADCRPPEADDNPPSAIQIPNYALTGKTILMGINEEELKDCQISANGSCTTNAVSPVLRILNQSIGIEKAILNTIHSYTATQKLVDSPAKKDFRKGRAGAQNIIPSTTGAAIATTLAIKELKGKFDGLALRVPTVLGSIVDLTFIAKRVVTAEEINKILAEASQKEEWQDIFTTTTEPIVSSDIIGNSHASIADLSLTKVVDGTLVKVLIWYDNELGYAQTLVKHLLKTAQI